MPFTPPLRACIHRYAGDPPGLQLFNCAAQAPWDPAAPLAGATKLCDGYRAAEHLRLSHPATYAYLCRVPLRFTHVHSFTPPLRACIHRYAYLCRVPLRFSHVGGGVHYAHAGPVFELHPLTAEVAGVRYNETDRAPLMAP